MNDYDKPKLCPYRKLAIEPSLAGVRGTCGYDFIGDFLPCLQDKCAMWRETVIQKNVTKNDYGTSFDNVLTGYCGLAGKP